MTEVTAKEIKLQEAFMEPILHIKAGASADEVFYSERKEGFANEGPSSFTMDKNNIIYVLDPNKKKILLFKNAQWLKNINIPFCKYPRDLLCSGDYIYLLDESDYIFKIHQNGDVRDQCKLPQNLKSYEIQRLAINSYGHVMAVTSNYEYFITTSRFGGKKYMAAVTLKFLGEGSHVNIRKNNYHLASLSFTEKLGGMNVVGTDDFGNSYLEVMDYVSKSGYMLLEHTLRAINKEGKQIGVVRIPLEEYENYPKKFFHITNEGQIYFMALKKQHVEIVKVTLGERYISILQHLKNKVSLRANSFYTQAITAEFTSPYTRDDVYRRVNNILELEWKYEDKNRKNPDASNITPPDYLVNGSINQKSIPYCWGGYDGLDTSSGSGWRNFAEAMQKGAFAGNVNHTGYYKGGTAGLDCSGFVSSAYGFRKKYSTYQFTEIGKPVGNDLIYMDYFVSPGLHTFIFESWSDSSKTAVNSVEQTVTGEDRVKRYQRTIPFLQVNDYVARSIW